MKSKTAKKSTSNMKVKVQNPKKQQVKKQETQAETKLEVKKVEPAVINDEKKVQLIKKVPVPPVKKLGKIEQPANNKKPTVPQPQPVKPKAINHHIKLIKNLEKDKKVVAVIISFHSQASYDHLFTHVEQKAEEGTQVLVYSCNSKDAKYILEAFKK